MFVLCGEHQWRSSCSEVALMSTMLFHFVNLIPSRVLRANTVSDLSVQQHGYEKIRWIREGCCVTLLCSQTAGSWGWSLIQNRRNIMRYNTVYFHWFQSVFQQISKPAESITIVVIRSRRRRVWRLSHLHTLCGHTVRRVRMLRYWMF